MAMISIFIKSTVVPILLRLGLAAIFLFHGMQKISGPENEWGANWANKMTEPPPSVLQLAIAWGELGGGIAMAIGFLTRLAGLGIIALMAGAIATVRWQNGFDDTQQGFEYNFAIIIMALGIVLGGPGPVAVDRFFRLRRRKRSQAQP
jgi:putative oxidoreductase